jgi:hypothetical protein
MGQGFGMAESFGISLQTLRAHVTSPSRLVGFGRLAQQLAKTFLDQAAVTLAAVANGKRIGG